MVPRPMGRLQSWDQTIGTAWPWVKADGRVTSPSWSTVWNRENVARRVPAGASLTQIRSPRVLVSRARPQVPLRPDPGARAVAPGAIGAPLPGCAGDRLAVGRPSVKRGAPFLPALVRRLAAAVGADEAGVALDLAEPASAGRAAQRRAQAQRLVGDGAPHAAPSAAGTSTTGRNARPPCGGACGCSRACSSVQREPLAEAHGSSWSPSRTSTWLTSPEAR